jgi:putative transposase
MNHAVGNTQLFRKEADYEAFQQVLIEACRRKPMRILSYCMLPDRWHLVVYPRKDGQLTDFVRWITHTHAVRHRAAHKTIGFGHIYQGRFKNFIVQRDESLTSLRGYVERLALSERLVRRAEKWRWSSLWARLNGPDELKDVLEPCPMPRPAAWTDRVNRPIEDLELARIQTSVMRGRPYGDDRWVAQTTARLGLEHTIRPQGRPRKNPVSKKK